MCTVILRVITCRKKRKGIARRRQEEEEEEEEGRGVGVGGRRGRGGGEEEEGGEGGGGEEEEAEENHQREKYQTIAADQTCDDKNKHKEENGETLHFFDLGGHVSAQCSSNSQLKNVFLQDIGLRH